MNRSDDERERKRKRYLFGGVAYCVNGVPIFQNLITRKLFYNIWMEFKNFFVARFELRFFAFCEEKNMFGQKKEVDEKNEKKRWNKNKNDIKSATKVYFIERKLNEQMDGRRSFVFISIIKLYFMCKYTYTYRSMENDITTTKIKRIREQNK